MLITVIIPIYNTSIYLTRCIDSIVKQNLDDVELIFIDDCSTDDSYNELKRCLSYYDDLNFQLLRNHKNLGSGETRNIGIKKASGDYVIFIDSDDYITDNYFSVLITHVNKFKSDIVIFDYTEIFKDKINYKNCAPAADKEVIIADLIQSKMHNSLCNKLFRRSLFIDNNILIPYGMSMFEDKSICFRLFEKANKISHIKYSLYFYDRTREGSLTSRNQEKNLSNALLLMDVINNHFKYSNPTQLIQQALYNNRILITGLFALYDNLKRRELIVPRIGAIKLSAFLKHSEIPIHFKLSALFYYYDFPMLLCIIKTLYFKLKK